MRNKITVISIMFLLAVSLGACCCCKGKKKQCPMTQETAQTTATTAAVAK